MGTRSVPNVVVAAVVDPDLSGVYDVILSPIDPNPTASHRHR
jgi:hypothetical protein